MSWRGLVFISQTLCESEEYACCYKCLIHFQQKKNKKEKKKRMHQFFLFLFFPPLFLLFFLYKWRGSRCWTFDHFLLCSNLPEISEYNILCWWFHLVLHFFFYIDIHIFPLHNMIFNSLPCKLMKSEIVVSQ